MNDCYNYEERHEKSYFVVADVVVVVCYQQRVRSVCVSAPSDQLKLHKPIR